MSILSIITPTFNRAPLLSRCFESLLCQTCFDFEWIVVDDGSTDDTVEVVASFHPNFEFKYIQKSNGGKHTALNAAHPFVHGEYVLILDSDDCLINTAVQEVLEAWGQYKQNQNVGIVTFLKGQDKEHPVCTVEDFNTPVEIMRYQRHIISSSDCCEVIRADLFLQYPFPEYENERFIAECALWNRISFNYKAIYINSVIYICEYLDGGLTRSGRALRINNPKGGMFISNLRMDKSNYFKQRIKYSVMYTCYARFSKVPMSAMLGNARSPVLALVCAPAGEILYRYWKKKYGNNIDSVR